MRETPLEGPGWARELPGYAREVLAGLTGRPRRLPAHLLYDARGSELFEHITRLPEYYLTRTELRLLEAHAAEVAALCGAPPTVVELGAGTATKTRVVLEAVRAARGPGAGPLTFHPLDVSADALALAASRLGGRGVEVRPLVGRYEDCLPLLRTLPGPRLVLFIGSSVGNLEPAAAVALLSQVREALAPGDALLLGADLRKEPSVLLPAYDDAAGVTAAFEKNVLLRLNRDLGADFEPDAFTYRATWNAEESCVEMGLESRRAQRVRLPALGLELQLQAGERIATERSYKWSRQAQLRLLSRAGLQPERLYSDARRWYALHLARVP
jgi:dimethylhistidine N-methyltransferase